MSSPDDAGAGDLRAPTAEEQRMLDALLGADFPGRGELLAQAKDISVSSIDAEGNVAISALGGPRSPVVRRIPVEAELEDADGTTAHILLHVVDGRMKELEIHRDDSGAIQGVIDPQRFRLIVL
jgi:hypothetical protein